MTEEADVVMSVVLTGEQVAGGGRTRLFRHGAEVTHLTRVLKIVHYEESPEGWYLIRYGPDGEEVGDTYHESILRAQQQAEFEFGVREEQWVGNPRRR